MVAILISVFAWILLWVNISLKVNPKEEYKDMLEKEALSLKLLSQSEVIKVPKVLAIGSKDNKNYMLMFSNDKARNLYSHHYRKNNVQDSLQFYKKEGKIIENKLKAIIQRYSRDLIHNQTTLE